MTDFLIWYFNGLGSIGGWLIFLVLGLAGLISIFAHSASRRIPAVGWKVIAFVAFLLICPTLVFRFTGPSVKSSLYNYTDAFFYIGIISGILPAILAIGYLVVYRGMVGCGHGHVFDKRLGVCPDCPPEMVITRQNWGSNEPVTDISGSHGKGDHNSPLSDRKKAAAWLVAESGNNYQLYEDETTIGRISENDIKLDDPTVGRRHAKIVDENGHYKLYDLGSTNYSRVNGRIIRKPMLIESEDDIQFGDNSIFKFKC